MTLRLRVISAQRRQLAGRDSVEIGLGGGTIGRSADNDWVLPDARRYVSAHHARISWREGRFYLEDLSTNGVYVNDAAEPLGRQGPDAYRLRDGDVLRIGEYQIGVSLEDSPTSDSAALLPSRILAVRPLAGAQTDIGAALHLEDLLAVDAGGTGEMQPGDAFGQGRAAAPNPYPSPAVPPTSRAPRVPEPGDDTVARRLSRLARAAAREDSAVPTDGSEWQVFCLVLTEELEQQFLDGQLPQRGTLRRRRRRDAEAVTDLPARTLQVLQPDQRLAQQSAGQVHQCRGLGR